MFKVKEFPGREFSSQKEMHRCLVDNKGVLLSFKKSAPKFADAVGFGYYEQNEAGVITKAEATEAADATELRRKVVINTTKLYDSHGDVHIDGIWKRSLSMSSKKIHLQEHKRAFEAVITDDADAFTKTMSFNSLGAPYEGNTQALVFDSLIKQSRNSEMFTQYKNGWVKNHSVGMQYVELFLCINSEERWAADYKDNYEKYIEVVANKEDLQEEGYFWAVTEAKILEGSAVLFGSNWVTPTLGKETGMPPLALEPSQDTPKKTWKQLLSKSNS